MFAVMKERIRRLQRFQSGTVKTLGVVETLLGVMLLLTAAYALFCGENYEPFLFPAPVFLIMGMIQYMFFYRGSMSPSLGILLMLETWIVSFAAAIVPFVIYGFAPVDAVYEGVSGYTTTGSTIMTDIEGAESCILLWRALIQWAGGITVVIIFTLLLPMIGMGGKNLGSNEFGGSDNGEYSTSLSSVALNFFRIYVLLTAAEFVILIALGMTPFESICTSMSCVPTGGLLPFNNSMADFGFAIQATTLVFMILGASNFLFLFRLLFHRDRTLLKSREWRVMLLWFLGVALFMTAVVWFDGNYRTDYIGETFWDSLYAVTCAGTSSGFAVSDYTIWPILAVLMLMVVEFVGGTSGSTAGGIKIYRLMTMKAYIAAGMEKIMHPNAVTTMSVDGSHVDTDNAASVLSTVFLFVVGCLVGIGLILFFQNESGHPIEFLDSIGLVISSICNAGASIGNFGPMSSMAPLQPATKIVMTSLMFLGRMEMVFVLMVFTRRFWNDVRQSSTRIREKAVYTIRRSGKY